MASDAAAAAPPPWGGRGWQSGCWARWFAASVLLLVACCAPGADAARASAGAASRLEREAAAAVKSRPLPSAALGGGLHPAEEEVAVAEEEEDGEDEDDGGEDEDEGSAERARERAMRFDHAGWVFERGLLLANLEADPEAREELIRSPIRKRDGRGAARALALLAMLDEPLDEGMREDFDRLAGRRWPATLFVWACRNLELRPRERMRILDEIARMVVTIGADGKFIRDALSAMVPMVEELACELDVAEPTMEWLQSLLRRLQDEVPVAISKFERRRPDLADELRWRFMRLCESIETKIRGVKRAQAMPVKVKLTNGPWHVERTDSVDDSVKGERLHGLTFHRHLDDHVPGSH